METSNYQPRRIELKSSTNDETGYHLSPLRSTDKERIVEVMKDETISQNTLAIPFPYSLKDADWFLDFVSNEPSNRSLHFAIRVSNPEETFIGTIGILQMQTPMFTNSKPFKASLGYYLDKEYRGKGIVPLALEAVLQIAFEELELIRLEAAVFSWNTASERVLEKVGFQKEGVLRSYYWKNGAPVDGLMYSILNLDWKGKKQNKVEE